MPESSLIIEYLDRIAPHRAPMIPDDPTAALQARLWDRFFDGFIAVNVTKVVSDRFRPDERRDHDGVAQAEATMRQALQLFERTSSFPGSSGRTRRRATPLGPR